MKQKYEPVIGLEVHVELNTKSKMFCSCKAEYFGKKPNTQTCPVCLGLPGALPVPNRTAIEWCIKIGMALNCDIPLESKFDRKNYFYPDLPKGYQISQYDQPFAMNGSIEIRNRQKAIRIRRVHMEEDTAKLVHEFGNQNAKIKDQKYTLIDFNRSGVPLVEIVTEPDFDNAQDVKEYLQKIQQIVRYLDVSEADMEKGMMRLEPNISLHVTRNTTHGKNNVSPVTSHLLPSYKVEVKNINSFKYVEKAINFEIDRQAKILDEGKTPVQETRGWDEKKQITVSQRSKEEAHDYRYFPEPDIPPFEWTDKKLLELRGQLPELPSKKLERFIKEYNLSSYDAEILTREIQTADYFEEAITVSKDRNVTPKQLANYIINRKPDLEKTLPVQLVQNIIAASKTATVDEKHLEKVVQDVIIENTKAVEDYKKGNEKVMMFLIGQVIRKLKEKVDVNIIKSEIERNLK
ncbi:MAG: Asp-tRNA(Asn)/Glu-tRNA(Gln) amidotransferase subunit GatB [Candidatus Levybacteria bacterium]|nr:Asp-tRNA(Asn)/Glu-tRNA(Gln) amidotransferase subunit GatB [Candidatus Levybacteria bacterium]